MRKLLIFWIVSIGFISTVNAQNLKTESEVRELLETTMQLIVERDMKSALSLLAKNSPFPEDQLVAEAIAEESRRKESPEKLGKSLKYEFLSSQKVGTTLARYIYLEITEKRPISWVFTFYKPVDTWSLSAFASEHELGGPFVYQAFGK